MAHITKKSNIGGVMSDVVKMKTDKGQEKWVDARNAPRLSELGWSYASAPTSTPASTPAPRSTQLTLRSTQPVPRSTPRSTPQPTTQPTLIEITSQRPDVLTEARKHGGDPYTAGTGANTWLNDWYNTTGKAEGADMAAKGMFGAPATQPSEQAGLPAEQAGEKPIDKPTGQNLIAQWQKKWVNIAGITGFYRVQGQPTVYAIGEGGGVVGSEAELAWLTQQTGKPLRADQVEVISAEKAAELRIQVPGAEPLPDANVQVTEKITDDANQIQEDFFDNLPADTTDTRKSEGLLDEMLADTEEAPEPPNLMELFNQTKIDLGMEPLETELAGIESQIEAINTELLIQAEEAGEELVSMAEIGRKRGGLQMEAQNRIARLNLQKNSISRQLNNKINTLNMIMGFTQQDYANASAAYNTKFNQNLQLVNLLVGQENKEIASTQANLNTIFNMMTESGKTFGDLSENQQMQIFQMEQQVGVAPGTFSQFMLEHPDTSEIVATQTGTDAEGMEFVSFISKDKDGTFSVEKIYTGATDEQTQIITAGGRKLLVNKRTGETIRDLGGAYKPTAPTGVTEEDQTIIDAYTNQILNDEINLNNVPADYRNQVAVNLAQKPEITTEWSKEIVQGLKEQGLNDDEILNAARQDGKEEEVRAWLEEGYSGGVGQTVIEAWKEAPESIKWGLEQMKKQSPAQWLKSWLK